MGHIESNLIPGEQVLYKTGLHWVVTVRAMVCGGFFALVGVLTLFGDSVGAGIFWLAVGGLVVYLGHLQREATEMAVTNQRIIIKTGLLKRRTFEMLTSKVESIGVEEGLLGRVLVYGTVVVRGTGGTPEPFRTVAHPLEFRRQVQQQIEHREQQMARPAQVQRHSEDTITVGQV